MRWDSRSCRRSRGTKSPNDLTTGLFATGAMELAGFDHAEEQVWRQLDKCKVDLVLMARVLVRRKASLVAWSGSKLRNHFTLLMKRVMIGIIRQKPAAKERLRDAVVSWDEATSR